MKVLQLIDSLRPGGAERMAVNLANALLPHIEASFLCCTRLEGELKQALDPGVNYLFLQKKKSLDIGALHKLREYIKIHNIDIVHAHGTSYFIAGLLKITGSNIKLVWHEHFGKRTLKKAYNFPVLYIFSILFDGIITVNKDLLKWTKNNLNAKNEVYIPNFVPNLLSSQSEAIAVSDKKYIVCLANLKVPKNHLNLLKAFAQVVKKFPEYKLYLIGKDYNDEYKKNLEIFIDVNDLKINVIFKGEIINNFSILQQAKVGVLSSDSEGLPMALLEYASAGLPVVCTNVGFCGEIVGGFGKVVPPNDEKALSIGINYYLNNSVQGRIDANHFRAFIEDNYSEKIVIPQFYSFYKKLLIRHGKNGRKSS